MSETTLKLACIQMDSQDDKAANLETARQAIREAAANGAQLICFPEVWNHIGEGHQPDQFEGEDGPSVRMLCEEAKQLGVWIHGGSIKVAIPGETRAFNTTFVVNSDGEIVARYDKLHTFDITLPDGTETRESDRVKPGGSLCTFDTPWGKCGTAICYDIRFAEMFRLMALDGAQIIFTPADFTHPTGQAHWETILRTRAIENGCFIVATDQVGRKPMFEAHGNTLVIDPWGGIIARGSQNAAEIVYADINMARVDEVRASLPCLQHRREDIYQLSAK